MKAFWVLSLTSRLISSLISTMTLSAAALIATGGAFGAVLRSPMGEEADYALDKGGSRTSNLISKGSGNGLVDQDLPDHEFGPSYGTLMNYQLVVKIQGTYTGSMRFVFPDEYFTPQFMVDLRQNGTFETRDYKMKHEGRGDARTLDGGTYPQCDRILMYDIKNAFSFEFMRMLVVAAGLPPEVASDGATTIENLQIHTYIHPSVPALGAAKLDISGIVNGISVKVGFDYKRP